MTAKEQKIAEIREALDVATPGRWIYDETVGDVYSEKTDEIICCADVNDAHLIANAPEWLRFLLSELDRTERENRVLSGIAEKLRKENRKLLEEREKLIDALQTIRTDTECPYTSAFAKRKLKEIGVTVE